jgi:predicted nucleic acid-binding protein
VLVLDSTVFIAALDRGRTSHAAVRAIFSSTVSKAVSTQTMREALAVATRPMNANGLGLGFDDAWRSILALRLACDRLLHESEAWWTSYQALAEEIRPTGRSIHDLGQVAHAHSQGRTARLLTDDDGLRVRYAEVIDIVTVAAYRARGAAR